MRLQNNISLTYIVSKGIDINKLMIPSFIVQPIVENAIWHGFAKKKSDGIISINFRAVGKILSVEIIDNGLGLTSTENNTSRSMSINQKRLELLSKLYDERFEIILSNRLSENGEILGCIVNLTLPVILEENKI